ncbi:MAG: lysophospholipid acyltransferase family protein [Ignavibacteria bacterium]
MRKKVALGNLDLCYPEKNVSWKNNIIKESYINLGINMFEFLYLPKLNKDNVKKLVRLHNNESVEESISKGKGTFILSGHFASWELAVFAYPLLTDGNMNIIAKIQASRGLNKKINEFRQLSGNKIIEIGFSLKEIFIKVKQNGIFAFLIDQSANPDYSAYINFFGMNVPAFSGPAKIALRQRPELFIAYNVRQKDYSYIIHFEKFNYSDLIGSSDENVIELTQRMQTMIEAVIRKYPGQWLWFHKRFKHRRTDTQQIAAKNFDIYRS